MCLRRSDGHGEHEALLPHTVANGATLLFLAILGPSYDKKSYLLCQFCPKHTYFYRYESFNLMHFNS